MAVGDVLLAVCFLPALIPLFMKRSGWDKFALFWYTFTTIVHCFFDSSYAYLCWFDEKGVSGSENFFAEIWRGYDARYLTSDPEILSVETIVMLVFTPMALINLYTTYYNTHSRHFWQLVLAAPSILGTYFCFIPEMMKVMSFLICPSSISLSGSPNLDWKDPYHKYFYFYFVNGLWVLVPLILCYHSYVEICKQGKLAEMQKKQMGVSVKKNG